MPLEAAESLIEAGLAIFINPIVGLKTRPKIQ